MRKFLTHSALGAVAFGIAAWSGGAQATTLKVTACFVRNHDYVVALFKEFLEPLNAANSTLKLHYLGGPEVTPIQKQAPALKRGLVDMIFCPGAYYGGLMSEARLPGVQTRSIEELHKNGAIAMMQKAWGKNLNARILSWNFFGGQKFYIYTNFKPKLSKKTGLDLKGVKMRTTGLYKPLLQAMGATTVFMAPGDVYAGLERGVVDGLAWPWGSITVYGWEKFLKYRIKPDFYGASMLLLINRDKFKSLTKAEQDFLLKRSADFEKNGSKLIIEKGKLDDAKLKKAGVKDIELTGAVRDAYLKTIYGAKWAENDKLKYSVNYKKLKSLLYAPVN